MTRHGKTLRWAAPVLLGLALMAVPSATEAQLRRGPVGRMEMEQRVRQRFAEMVRTQLGLTSDQQGRMAEVLRESERERAALMLRERQLRGRVGRAPLGGGAAPELLPESRAREVLGEMVAIQEEEARLLSREQDALLEILSAPQLVRFYGMREQLAERIRRLQEGGPPPGRGPGGIGGGMPGGR